MWQSKPRGWLGMTAPSARRLSRRDVLRGTVLVLGSIPGAALLAACGGAAPPAPGPAAQTGAGGGAAATAAPASGPTAAAQVAATPATAAGRTVVRDHDWLQGNPGQQGDWYDQFVAQFEDEHQDIKVQREWFPRNDMHAKELALAATGQIGDTVRINVAPLTAELQLKNVARELNSLYQSDQDWMNNDMKQFWAGQPQDVHAGRQAVRPARRRPSRRRPVLRQ